MVIKNKTRGKILAEEHQVYDSILSKARGLMFSKQKNIIFIFRHEKRIPLHMFFVFFPIDVLYLDSEKRVIEMIKDFKPFRYYSPRYKSKYVLELPQGMISKTDTNLKDIIEF